MAKKKQQKQNVITQGTVATNRRARYDYEILESFECGIALTGSEVKSIRQGKVVLKDSYAKIDNGEIWLLSCHISPYSFANGADSHEPERARKLLLHKYEITHIDTRLKQGPLTLIPLSIYLTRGKIKLQLGLAKGRRNYDKRHMIAERDAKKESARAAAMSRRVAI